MKIMKALIQLIYNNENNKSTNPTDNKIENNENSNSSISNNSINKNNKSSSSISTGVIIGIIVGGVMFVSGFITIIIFCRRSKLDSHPKHSPHIPAKDNVDTINASIKYGKNPSINEYEPTNDKENLIIIIFKTTS